MVGTLIYEAFNEMPAEREKDFHCYLVSRQEKGTVKCERVREKENDFDWQKVNDALWY